MRSGRCGLLGHALFGNAQMNAARDRQVPCSGQRFDFFKQFLGLGKFLLMEMLDSLFVELQLLLELGINHLTNRFRMCRNFTIFFIFQ